MTDQERRKAWEDQIALEFTNREVNRMLERAEREEARVRSLEKQLADVQKAVEAEREACARLVEELGAIHFHASAHVCTVLPSEMAKAIRARGQL